MRDFIIENYQVREEIIYLDDLKNFDEAFISNSLMGVRNVSLINDIIFNEEDKTNLIQVDIKKYGF